MSTKQALNKMCTNCEKGLAYKKVRCPFRSISNEYCEEYEKLKNDSEILEIIKQHSGIVEMYSNVAKLDEHFVCEINDKQNVEKLKEWLNKTRKNL